MFLTRENVGALGLPSASICRTYLKKEGFGCRITSLLCYAKHLLCNIELRKKRIHLDNSYKHINLDY